MAIDAGKTEGESVAVERPLAHLRASPEERARFLAAAPPPRSLHQWLGEPQEWSAEDQSDLDWFLEEREKLRRLELVRVEEKQRELEE
jgi:hypothetical protein